MSEETRPSRQRTKAKAAEARREILGVAARMMREIGYADMSLRDLAAEVGMKAGSLYYHFPSKEALATEVMRLGVEVVEDAVQVELEQNGHLSARERLVLAMRIHLKTLLSESDFSSAHIRCYPFVPDTVREELKAVRRAYNTVWNDIIGAYLGAAATPVQIRHLRYTLLGAMNWSLEWFNRDRDDVDAYVASIAALLPEQD
ncbi:TetR/AcrR family transcriptional regulator [Roseibium sp. SCP14]|uniref:TetR/AcrR family transcriptional regulator n=1 Tax=Roseibium sp. SCP14 TaxID=3141375 RepID=UPI00333D77B4